MLLTITIKGDNADKLGFLLHKHPDKLQTVSFSGGDAHIFYPVSQENISTAALLLEIDAINLVKNTRQFAGTAFSLAQYVNDRPYVASSFLSTAISKVYSTALNGTCKTHPSLVDNAFEIEVKIGVVSAKKGGKQLIKNLFEPLNYEVIIDQHEHSELEKDWGNHNYYTVELKNTTTVQSVLKHLYVLLPVLDNDKHYFIGEDEINKLLAKGEGWLVNHPFKSLISKRYLKNLKRLTRRAINNLSINEDDGDEGEDIDLITSTELKNKLIIEAKKRKSLHSLRLEAACEQLLKAKATSVIDLGCGEAKLIKLLLKHQQFTQITGVDVSYNELLKAQNRLHWETMPSRKKEKINLFQGALNYRDKRFKNHDAAALIEVIEHIDEDKLPTVERIVFEFMQTQTIVVTTPNKEFNSNYQNLKNTFRHNDHRFEWTRQEFANWVDHVNTNFGYSAIILPIGDVDPNKGASSQMAVFTKN